MLILTRLRIIAIAASTLFTSLGIACAGEMKVEAVWARASAGATGAVFVVIANESPSADRLLTVQSPIASDAMIHRSFEQGGVMRMEHVPALPIDAGQRLEMKPGGLHIMLMGLKQPLRKGEEFPLVLGFEHGGATSLTVKVYGPGAMKPD